MAYGPNQSLDSLLQLAQTVFYGREYEEKKERQKKTKEEVEALVMAVRTVLKQPEKNAQRDPGEKGWACYRKWQSTPVLLPGEPHGGRSLVGYSSWGRKESDTTERLHFTSLHFSHLKLSLPKLANENKRVEKE